MKSFSDLGLEPRFSNLLLSRSIKEPSAIQEIVIPKILEGRNIIFSSATGTGKTFAYLLPILQKIDSRIPVYEGEASPPLRTCGSPLPPLQGLAPPNPQVFHEEKSSTPKIYEPKAQALILSPTIELASQIKHEVDFLLSRPENTLNSILIVGSASKEKQIDAIKKKKGNFISGNASRILQLIHEKKARFDNIRYVILDEADRLLSDEMFDQTKELLSYINRHRSARTKDRSAEERGGALPRRALSYQLIACSATIPEKTKEKIARLFDSGPPDDLVFVSSHTRDILQNYISHWVIWGGEREKLKSLSSFLSVVHAKRVLVFADRVEEVHKTAGFLQSHKVKAAALYSGMDKKERKDALEKFRSGSIEVLVSSDIAARGLDVPDIKYVVSLGAPKEADVYVHRAGRTGRAGKKGIIVSIGSESELLRLASLEKKLGIAMCPKILYQGCLLDPEEFESI
ncbi:MAG: DEAD/DEAH box helicase [Spirochaetaceae bacterium]|jgi:superfamily II DNA/RNA helicase|nr:DEAD/DEAH box helicase [Spirochaetaceae bacterium]